jgi:hypothetical protein
MRCIVRPTDRQGLCGAPRRDQSRLDPIYYDDARQQLRGASRESDEDVVMDATDYLVGWCSRKMRMPLEANESRRDG